MKVFAEKKFPCLHFISARIAFKTSLVFKEKKETNETFFRLTLPGSMLGPGKKDKKHFSSVIFFFFKNKFQKFLYFQLT